MYHLARASIILITCPNRSVFAACAGSASKFEIYILPHCSPTAFCVILADFVFLVNIVSGLQYNCMGEWIFLFGFYGPSRLFHSF